MHGCPLPTFHLRTATDIMDKDLKTLRNMRWEKAFSGEIKEEVASDQTNRKATIVIEHLMQASDVSHTMQHWHIYRKWVSAGTHRFHVAPVKDGYDEDHSIRHSLHCLSVFSSFVLPIEHAAV